ncbi:MAG: RNA polymerase sigma factor [Pseudomonadota bacterium]
MRRDDISRLFIAHGNELQRFLERRMQCTEAASELTQEAFLRLVEREPHEIRNHRAYLYRIALNALSDVMALRRRHLVALHDISVLQRQMENASAEDHAISMETLRRLEDIIATLPDRQREVLRLHKIEGLKYSEIAARLGISKNTVMVHMVRALARCRDEVSRD